jgi:hypothetical protein
MMIFYISFLFIGGGAVSLAFIFKVVVVQRFGGAVGAVFENGTVSVSRHARFYGVHFSPGAARSGRARVLAQLPACRFQFRGFS